MNKYTVIKEFRDVDNTMNQVGAVIYATPERGAKLIRNGLVTLLEEYTEKLVQTRYRDGKLELFNSLTGEIISVVDASGIDDVNEVKAAIANFEETGGGGLTTGQVETIVDGKMGALVSPVTAGLNFTTPSGAVEVGASVTPAMSWTIGNSSNAKSAKITETTNSNAKITDVTVAASGTYTFAAALQSNVVATKTYRLDVTDKLDRVISSTARSINWYYPVFSGSSAKASGLTEAEIEAFSKSLKASASGTYSFEALANSYKWIFVHESFSPTSFKSGGGFDMPMQSPITITITNEFGVSLNLKGYRTTNATSGALDIVVA